MRFMLHVSSPVYTIRHTGSHCIRNRARPFVAMRSAILHRNGRLQNSYVGLRALARHRVYDVAPALSPYSAGNRWGEFESHLLAYAVPSFSRIRASLNSPAKSHLFPNTSRAASLLPDKGRRIPFEGARKRATWSWNKSGRNKRCDAEQKQQQQHPRYP